MAVARDARVVAAAAVLLHLHRRRRRRHRRAALGDPERPRGVRRRGEVADRRRRADLRPTATGPPRRAPTIDRALAEAGATARTETIETPTMVRPADRVEAGGEDGRAAGGAAELSAVRHASSSRAAAVLARAARRTTASLVRPELLTALGVKVGDQISIGQATFTIRGVDHERAGAAASAGSASARACSSTTPTCRRPGCSASAAARDRGMLVQGAGRRSSSRSSRTLRARLQGRVHQRPLVPLDRGSDRPRLRSRRELPEPGRADHRHPRRHRGVERDARVHPAEDPQHRRAEMRRRAQRPDHRGLHPAGDDARPGRQPAGRRRWRGRDCGDSAGARRRRRRSWPRRTTA